MMCITPNVIAWTFELMLCAQKPTAMDPIRRQWTLHPLRYIAVLINEPLSLLGKGRTQSRRAFE